MINRSKRPSKAGPSSRDLKHQADRQGIYDWNFPEDRCSSSMIIEGEGYPCDLNAEHRGWAHQNLEKGALW